MLPEVQATWDLIEHAQRVVQEGIEVERRVEVAKRLSGRGDAPLRLVLSGQRQYG